MLLKCSKDTNQDMELPLNSRKVLIFIDYLARTRGLKGATVSSYLSGVRQMHIVHNLDPPEIRNGLVKLVLKKESRTVTASVTEKPTTKVGFPSQQM